MINKCISFFLLFLPLFTSAQPDQVPASMIGHMDGASFRNYFNSDSVRLRDGPPMTAPYKNTGLFIAYEKADTLDFNDPFFEVDTPFNKLGSTSNDYIFEGLAYYERAGKAYQKRFANDHAFFCASCENMGEHSIEVHGDTATLSISWGPRFNREDKYVFVYRPAIKRWQIAIASSIGSFYGDYNSLYAEYPERGKIFLDHMDTDGFLYSPQSQNTSHKVEMHYTSGNYAELLSALKKIPPQNYGLIDKIFTTNDARFFTTDKDDHSNITSSNVVAANHVGYFLEQANQLNTAKIFLDHVIKKFPDREVAWLNLGDVYRKKGNSTKTLEAYQKYVKLMKREKKENEIPDRVKSFVEKNKE